MRKNSGFTLVELLAAIAIIAILVTAAGFYVADYITRSRLVANQQTLAILNAALDRYKTEGGSLAALTQNAPISNVLARLSTATTWVGGLKHQFLNTGKTYAARSLMGYGNGTTYEFTRYDHYDAFMQGTANSSALAALGTTGSGIGYMSRATPGTFNVGFITVPANGWIALQDQSGNITYSRGGGALPAALSYRFWACTNNGDPTPSGTISNINCNSNHLASLNVSALSQLDTLGCSGNQLSSLDLSSLSLLRWLGCASNQLTHLNVTSLSNLQYFYCYNNNLTSVDITGDIKLPPQSSSDTWATNFVTDPGTSVSGP